jgi:(1->4)-alpha-D-glucan 1-alpha-D-glucosylmutase
MAAGARRAPLSTYRLQLHGGFPFSAAQATVPYLARLGITDCYLSPIFAATPGSRHGYDVTDHNRINDELGGPDEYDRLSAAIAAADMGQILDIVPNHMGVDEASNPWWRDLLENGLTSVGARFFDIDWRPVKPELHGRVLLPILGDQYGHVLERGELQVAYAAGRLELHYGDRRLPIDPKQIPLVLRPGIDRLQADGGEDPALAEFLSILSALAKMPGSNDPSPEAIAERRREKDIARERLARTVEGSLRLQRHVEKAIALVNGEPGRPSSFDALHDLLEAQPYRLAYWRTAAHEINYRRFFDVNQLAALRVQDPDVFDAIHGLLFQLLQRGEISGLRVDHPDGLFDPAAYFERLQGLAARAWKVERAPGTREPLFVVAEKILSPGESMPGSWAVDGTTGYGFLQDLNGLFMDETGARRLRRAYVRFTGLRASFEDVAYESKRLIMNTALASELNVLAYAIDRIGERNRRARDFTLNSLRDAIGEVVACFPVYRTYVTLDGWSLEDRRRIDTAVRRARQRNPALEASAFEFLREVLLPRGVNEPLTAEVELDPGDRRSGYPPASDAERRERLEVAMKFQQYTAPVQAKGIEDTAFYRYNVLLALNEVGGDPSRPGGAVRGFHDANRNRRKRFPRDMLATATHDTKLGEDVRARLAVLSELTEAWAHGISRWRRINQSHRTIVDGAPAPHRNDEYRFYQALVGIWPPEMPRTASEPLVTRLREYMNKSIKEAKVHTSWINENRAYDAAMARFVERSLTGAGGARFLSLALPFIERVARHGAMNSLAHVALKLTSPGIPDFYQGTELWDLTLVDPDNRRPPDFDHRARLLQSLEPLLSGAAGRGPGAGGQGPEAGGRGSEAGAPGPKPQAPGPGDLLAAWPDGRIKLFVTACGLRLRRSMQAVVTDGDYVPLDVDVTIPAGIVAFARTHDDRTLITVVSRLSASLCASEHAFPVGPDFWKTSRVLLPPQLAARSYRNALTGERIEPTETATQRWIFAGEALRVLPIAMLLSE